MLPKVKSSSATGPPFHTLVFFYQKDNLQKIIFTLSKTIYLSPQDLEFQNGSKISDKSFADWNLKSNGIDVAELNEIFVSTQDKSAD